MNTKHMNIGGLLSEGTFVFQNHTLKQMTSVSILKHNKIEQIKPQIS